MSAVCESENRKVLAGHGGRLPESREPAKGDSVAELLAARRAETSMSVAVESFSEKRTEDFRAPILGMDQNDLTQAFSAALRQEFGEQRKARYRVAEAANSNARAAENWLAGQNTPDLLHGLRLAATVPAWRAELRRLLALDAEPDSEIERELSEFVTRMQRRFGDKP
jgi:hypothetical protein